jgi:hypothetical protein
VIKILEEIELIEETDDFLKFKVNNLKLRKLTHFIIENGKNEEFHLVEMELLLNSFKLVDLNNMKIGKDVVDMIVDLINNEKYMDVNLDYKLFFNKIKNLEKILDKDLCIAGEITAFKGSLKSDYNLSLIKS